MKKLLIAFGIIFLLIGGYVGMAHLSGGAFSTLGLPIGGDRNHLRSLTLQFIEDIKFKDFKKAASYHAPDKQEEVDIPFFLERLFLLKPEAIDVMSYEIVFSELDSSNLRGRVKARIKCKDLVRNAINEKEIIFFYHRSTKEDPWYMVLESSLRQVKEKKKKK